jgi:hypothetical protein
MADHADFDIFNTDGATGHIVEHLTPQGNNYKYKDLFE